MWNVIEIIISIKVIGLLGVLDLDCIRFGEVVCDLLFFCRVVSDWIFFVLY